MCKKTTKYIHYRYTLQERKEKSLTKKLFHLHPIERLILWRGVGLGVKTERFERWVMRDQSHLFRGSQNFWFSAFFSPQTWNKEKILKYEKIVRLYLEVYVGYRRSRAVVSVLHFQSYYATYSCPIKLQAYQSLEWGEDPHRFQTRSRIGRGEQ